MEANAKFSWCFLANVIVFLVLCLDSSESRCPPLNLQRGKVRSRQRGRMVRFQCLFGYQLIGQKFAVCTFSGWDSPVPICVRSGCKKLPEIENGLNIETDSKVQTLFYCHPGYSLVGESSTFCDGRIWNGTMPTCKVVEKESPPLSCDFETDTCGWTAEETSDFAWKRNVVTSVPQIDHTTLSSAGHIMSLVALASTPRGKTLLISPVFPSKVIPSGCLSFYYHSFDPYSAGALRVYVHPESVAPSDVISNDEEYRIVEIVAEQNYDWQRVELNLESMTEDFQIIFEGSKEASFGGIKFSIDDINITSNACTDKYVPNNKFTLSILSCANRCTFDAFRTIALCHCSEECYSSSSSVFCCPDFTDHCVSDGTESYTTDSDIEINTSSNNAETSIIETETEKAFQQSTNMVELQKQETIPSKKYYFYKTTQKNDDKTTKSTQKFSTTISPPKTIPTTRKTTQISTTITATTKMKILTTVTTKKPTIRTTVQSSTKPTIETTNITKAAVFKPTLQFKTPPQPLKNATGRLNKTVTVVKNDTIYNVSNITLKPATNSGIRVILLNNTTTKAPKVAESGARTPKFTNLNDDVELTTYLENIGKVSKTYEHYGRDEDGKVNTNAKLEVMTTTPTEENSEENFTSGISNKVSDVADLILSKPSTSKIVIVILSLAVFIVVFLVILSKTGHLRRVKVMLRMAPVRGYSRRQNHQNADMRFLVEDEELEHDL